MHLRCEDVSVRFDQRPALNELTLDVPAGTWLGVCGGPGSGKTTLLKTLAGLRRPDRGRVTWRGDDVASLSPETRRERQACFGMVFQTDALFDSSTLLENVLVPLRRRRVPEPEAQTRARAALEQVGMLHAAHLLPDALSGGMRKRAGIARAVVARPEILLADDPLAGLDPGTGSTVARLLLDLSREKTLIVALPDPVPWFPLPRWLLLDEGRLVYDGPFDPARLDRTEKCLAPFP
jgi:phospholipid/cholesterol/gamma-HCH transport system ATP-binding protein